MREGIGKQSRQVRWSIHKAVPELGFNALEARVRSAHQSRMASTPVLDRPVTDSSTGQAQAGRALPANLEAEAAFLGAILIDNHLLEELSAPLRPEHFFEPLHGRIFERIQVLLDKGMVVTTVTLKPYFDSDPAIIELGGINYLSRLTEVGHGLLVARGLAQQIYDLALLRELVSVGRELVENALDTSETVEPMRQIEEAEASLFRVAEGVAGGSEAESFGSIAKAAIIQAERALNSGGHIAGLTTGLASVNAKVGGLHESDLIILAGRPGMGKSSLAMNIAFSTARRYLSDLADGIDPKKSSGAPVAVFSLEMSGDQLAGRILAEQSGIPSEMIRMGKISREDFHSLSRASQDLNQLPLYIDDSPALSIAALRTRARRLKRKHNVGLIVIDYLQLMQGSQRTQDNRVNEISEITRGLKTLAKELNVPVIALSQLSRAVESREDKRPQLSDLRESGSIEQDADMVWFIFREDYYEESKEPDPKNDEAYRTWKNKMEGIHGLAELIIAKQRHGATGKVRLRFEPKITRFSDLAEGEYQGGYD